MPRGGFSFSFFSVVLALGVVVSGKKEDSRPADSHRALRPCFIEILSGISSLFIFQHSNSKRLLFIRTFVVLGFVVFLPFTELLLDVIIWVL